MNDRYNTMTDALLAAMAADPRSYNQLAKDSGLTRQSLIAFAKGRRSLRLDLADQLAELYGLQVVSTKGAK